MNCKQCNEELRNKRSTYCSVKCQQSFEYYRRVENWLNGSFEPKARDFFRRYLNETVGYSCSVCGISEWNGKPITLEIDHIDGNSLNNTPDNIRYICPNCHSQTETYKSKNKGNGRHYRRQRYKEGKSF